MTIVKEYRITIYTDLDGYEHGEYEPTGEYFDDLNAAKSALRHARIEAAARGQRAMIEMQEVEIENGEAVDHYGFSRVIA